MKNLKIVIPDPERQMPWDEEIYSMETGYDGKPTETFVGHVNNEKKTVRPTHGYYSPNPTSKKLKAYAKVLGYKYEE